MQFSLSRALCYLSDPAHPAARDAARQELRHRSERGGIVIPLTRDLDTTTGGDLIPDPVIGFAESLRAASILLDAGATFLPGLPATGGHPVMTSGATARWVAEVAAPSPSTPALETRPLAPSTLSVAVPFSRRLALAGTPQVDALLQRDIAAALAAEIDAAALGFSTDPDAPDGLADALAGTASELTLVGAVPTWAELLDIRAAVQAANAPGALSWVLSPAMAAALSQAERATGNGFCMERGFIADLPARVTSAAPDNTIICGAFGELVIGTFGPGVELRLDATTNIASDGRVSRAFVDTAFATRRIASFGMGVAP